MQNSVAAALVTCSKALIWNRCSLDVFSTRRMLEFSSGNVNIEVCALPITAPITWDVESERPLVVLEAPTKEGPVAVAAAVSATLASVVWWPLVPAFPER